MIPGTSYHTAAAVTPDRHITCNRWCVRRNIFQARTQERREYGSTHLRRISSRISATVHWSGSRPSGHVALVLHVLAALCPRAAAPGPAAAVMLSVTVDKPPAAAFAKQVLGYPATAVPHTRPKFWNKALLRLVMERRREGATNVLIGRMPSAR